MTAQSPANPAAKPAAGSRCPICSRPADPRLRPFCSRRCADVDLARWLGGVYRVESDDTPDGGRDTGDE